MVSRFNVLKNRLKVVDIISTYKFLNNFIISTYINNILKSIDVC